MNEDLFTRIATLIGIAATLAGGSFALFKWRRERQSPYLRERQEACKEAWRRLEELYEFTRIGPYERARFNELVRAVNMHLSKQGLILPRGEKRRLNEYMIALRALAELLTEANDTEHREELQEQMDITAAVPEEVFEALAGLRVVHDRAEHERERTMKRFRRILQTPA